MNPGQIKTAGGVLGAVLWAPLALAAWFGFIEWSTLGNDTPGDHITETMRTLTREHPWVLLLTAIWLAFWGVVVAVVGGHVWA